MNPETYKHLIDAEHFDEIIDVRSPSEFAIDHVPNAVNLPVLNDEERAQVGTIYVQESKFTARKLGASLVAANAAQHLKTHLADKPKEYRPLVYCWRGGQRSESLTTILNSIGWQAEILDGGYQTYRRLVWDELYNATFPTRVLLLDGNTGTGKTEILKLLRDSGTQVIDLEGLANHRGSHFGEKAGSQPSQKAFESKLVHAAQQLDTTRPVVIEAESSKIGNCTIPPSLLHAMKSANRIFVSANVAERARFVVSDYADLVAAPAKLANILERLKPYHCAGRIEEWHAFANAGQFEQLAAELMAHHYDPRYLKHRTRNEDTIVAEIEASDLTSSGLQNIATRITNLIAKL